MIDIEAPGVIISLVGDLQPMRMTNLLWLKGGIEVLNGDYSFWAFGFLDQKKIDLHLRVGTKDQTTVCTQMCCHASNQILWMESSV